MSNRAAAPPQAPPGGDAVTAAPPQPLQYARQGSKLPREVVTWLQSLHLPSSSGSKHAARTGVTASLLRNPKRDLSNGARIGEICACYWSDVPLHSLSSQLSLEHKRSNWRVLAKLFAKHGAPLSDAMVDGVIAARDAQYAEVFLLQLYSLLTGRPLRAPLMEEQLGLPPVVSPTTLPAYRPPQVVGEAGNHHDIIMGETQRRLGKGDDGDDVRWSADPRAMASDEYRRSGSASKALASYEEDGGDADDDDEALRQQYRQQTKSLRTGTNAARQPLSGKLDAAAATPTLPSLSVASRGATTNATEEEDDALDEDGRVKVKFTISVRAAKQSSTILAPKHRAKEEKKGGSSHSAGGGPTTQPAELPENEAAASAASQGRPSSSMVVGEADGMSMDATVCPDVAQWILALLANAVDGGGGGSDNGSEETHGARQQQQQVIRFFLHCQRTGAARRRCEEVWGVLLAQRERLAAHARVDSTAFMQLVEILLWVPAQLAARYQEAEKEGMSIPTGAFQCFAAVLSCLSALDPYRAAVTLKSGILFNTPLMQHFVSLHCQDAHVADGLASLLLAVTSGVTPAAATHQMSEAVTALSDQLFSSGAHPPDRASTLLLLTLRAATVRSSAATTNATNTAGSAPTAPPAGTSPLVAGNGISVSPTRRHSNAWASPNAAEDVGPLDWLQDMGLARAANALASDAESNDHRGVSHAKLAAAWLAVGLLQAANASTPTRAAAIVRELGPYLSPPHSDDNNDASTESGEDKGELIAAAYAVAYMKWLRAVTTAQSRHPSRDSRRSGADAQSGTAIGSAVRQMGKWLNRGTPTAEAGNSESDEMTRADGHHNHRNDPSALAGVTVAVELAYLLGDSDAAFPCPAPVSDDLEEASVVADAVVRHLITCAPTAAVEHIMSPASLTSPLWTAPMLGAVMVPGDFPAHGCPLLLAEALARLLPAAPQEKDGRSGGGGGGGGNGPKGELPPATVSAAAALQRRTGTVASALVRDGCQLPERTSLRLRWLYYFCREGCPEEADVRGNVSSRRSGQSADEQQGREGRWRAVWYAFYEDLTVVVAAAELLLLARQQQQQRSATKSNRAGGSGGGSIAGDDVTSAQVGLLHMAAMAQRVMVVWYIQQQRQQQRRPLALAPPTTVAPLAIPREGAETSEELTAATEWFRNIIMPTT